MRKQTLSQYADSKCPDQPYPGVDDFWVCVCVGGGGGGGVGFRFDQIIVLTLCIQTDRPVQTV